MPRSSLLRVLNEIHNTPWAIRSESLESIAAIVDRALEGMAEQQIEAVATRIGRPLDNSGNNVELRNGVAVLNITGPIYHYANIMTMISGATSLEVFSTDFQRAVDSSAVEHILLVVDSPGGQIDGVQEVADNIREASRIKPVTAYVDGMAASAGYWLAAAANRIVTTDTGLLGSVGVVASIVDKRGAQERQGVRHYEIVSSRAPYKRVDVATDDGRAQIQKLVDSLEAVMIERLAAFRGVTADHVVANFGQGSIMIASQAIAAGMADEITTFEPLVARLAATYAPRALFANSQKEMIQMAAKDETIQPTAPAPAAPAANATGTTGTLITSGVITGLIRGEPLILSSALTERQRIAAILALPEARGRDDLARMLALETESSVDLARSILAAAPTAAPAKPVNPLEAAMQQVPNPKVGAGAAKDEETAQDEANRVLAFVPKDRKIAS